jgi:hypothetical protein
LDFSSRIPCGNAEAAPLVRVDPDEMVADPLDMIPHDIVVTMMGGVSVTDRDRAVGTFQCRKRGEVSGAWSQLRRTKSGWDAR